MASCAACRWHCGGRLASSPGRGGSISPPRSFVQSSRESAQCGRPAREQPPYVGRCENERGSRVKSCHTTEDDKCEETLKGVRGQRTDCGSRNTVTGDEREIQRQVDDRRC